MASAFVELQQARHEADYDLARRFTRPDVLALLGVAQQAFDGLRAAPRGSSERKVFFLSLRLHTRWKRG